MLVDATDGKRTEIGKPGLYASSDFSPDSKFLLVTALRKPYSYRVPYENFTRSVQVWDRNGNIVKTIADLPISDEVPTQGVPTGPRDVEWQPLRSASLVWEEALDGGDPVQKVPFRDKVMTLSAPFAGGAEGIVPNGGPLHGIRLAPGSGRRPGDGVQQGPPLAHYCVHIARPSRGLAAGTIQPQRQRCLSRSGTTGFRNEAKRRVDDHQRRRLDIPERARCDRTWRQALP
jgi:hypothetical protein